MHFLLFVACVCGDGARARARPWRPANKHAIAARATSARAAVIIIMMDRVRVARRRVRNACSFACMLVLFGRNLHNQQQRRQRHQHQTSAILLLLLLHPRGDKMNLISDHHLFAKINLERKKRRRRNFCFQNGTELS